MKKKHNGEIPIDGTSAPYEVGYGKPPKHTRFRPGQSGNPKGRPKGHENPKTIFTRILNEKVSLREGERTRRVSKLEALIVRIVNGGLQGDPKQFQNFAQLLRAFGFLDEEVRADVPLTAEDDAIISAFFERVDRESVNAASAADPSDEARPALEKSKAKK